MGTFSFAEAIARVVTMDEEASVQLMGLVVGSVLCVAAVVLAVIGWRVSGAAKVIEATRRMSCRDLQAKPWHAAAGEPIVEVVGRARPLVEPRLAEFSRRPCVWYRSVVVEDYWGWEWDAVERADTRVETYRLIYDTETEDPFEVHDATGKVLVHPKGATVEVPLVLYETEEVDQGSWKDRFIGAVFGDGENVIGHRRQEWAILLEDELYVLGAAAGDPGSVRIERPADDGTEFILTILSEADLVADRRDRVRPYAFGSAAATVFGVFFLAVAAFA